MQMLSFEVQLWLCVLSLDRGPRIINLNAKCSSWQGCVPVVEASWPWTKPPPFCSALPNKTSSLHFASWPSGQLQGRDPKKTPTLFCSSIQKVHIYMLARVNKWALAHIKCSICATSPANDTMQRHIRVKGSSCPVPASSPWEPQSHSIHY